MQVQRGPVVGQVLVLGIFFLALDHRGGTSSFRLFVVGRGFPPYQVRMINPF